MSEGLHNGKLLDEIEKRRAYRALDERKIPEDVIGRVMKAATYAPSCFNNQSWRFVVVHEDEALEKVKQYLPDANYWVKKSPCIVLAATKQSLDCKLNDQRVYALFDLGLAVESLMMQAVHEGLYVHPIAGFKPEPIKRAVNIPDDYILITLVVLGFPGSGDHLNSAHAKLEKSERTRKPIEEVVMYNGWQES